MRLVVGLRLALVEVGLAQFVYLVALLLHLLLRRLYRLSYYHPVHCHALHRHAAYRSDELVRGVCPANPLIDDPCLHRQEYSLFK